jgi:hypothetical protein
VAVAPYVVLMFPTLIAGVSPFTCCATVPLLPRWLLSPLKVAVITCAPDASSPYVHCAVAGLVPLTPTVPHPGTLALVTLSTKFTDPPAKSRECGPRFTCPFAPVTVAVKVTELP